MASSTRPAGGHQPEVWLDSRQLRTLAHPLRSRLLSALRLDGPATATGLARALGTNSGATSYHLRQLAEAGMVVEESERGSTRQRYWRAAHAEHGWWHSDYSDPDDRAAVDWLAGEQIRMLAEEANRWRAAQPAAPREWQDAAAFNDAILHLPAERLRALNDELMRVVDRYRQASSPAADGAEQVLVHLYGFRRAGPTADAAERGAGVPEPGTDAAGPGPGGTESGPADGRGAGPA
jgi:DNA-binding transcriptional ArsR family regulator